MSKQLNTFVHCLGERLVTVIVMHEFLSFAIFSNQDIVDFFQIDFQSDLFEFFFRE